MKYLKIDTQKGYIESQGSVVDMSALVLETIGAMYDSLKANGNPGGAEFFRAAVVAGVTYPDSPVFNGSALHRKDSILVNVDEIERMRNSGK